MKFLCGVFLVVASLQVAAQTNVTPGTIRGTVLRLDGATGVADVQVLIVGPLTGPAANAAITMPAMIEEIAEGTGMRIQAQPATKVSGRINNTLKQGAQSRQAPSTFYLQSRDATTLNVAGVPSFPNMSQVEGEFEIRGVPPGSYDLITTVTDSNGRSYPGRVSLEVGRQDLQGVTLSIHPGAEIKARIFLDGKLIPAVIPASAAAGTGSGGVVTVETLRAQISGAQNSGPRLQFRSKDLYSGPFESAAVAGVRADAEGAYVYPSVPEGAYNINVAGIPANAYIDDIRSGDNSIYDSGIVVGERTFAPIDVMLRIGAQSIRGIVRRADGKPAVGATVVLVPPPARRENALLFKNTLTLINGDFTITNVPPGNYKLFAWESLPNTAYMNSLVLSKYERLGKEINVTPGGTLNFDLAVIPK